ncbi:hypothetical protein CEXT_81161 [Caerostris extrusa]|uniref:Uncharacterized protein n=1 Tax=Caerostris extrusa TaxID=172846 RepID=A0AAV4S5Q3_CAEEX|nr:hypothetical protein CEXT_81161 [Caerostris extrusa]
MVNLTKRPPPNHFCQQIYIPVTYRNPADIFNCPNSTASKKAMARSVNQDNAQQVWSHTDYTGHGTFDMVSTFISLTYSFLMLPPFRIHGRNGCLDSYLWHMEDSFNGFGTWTECLMVGFRKTFYEPELTW